MSGPVDWLAGLAHPRLALLILVGAATVAVGGALALVGPPLGADAGTTAIRMAIAGAIVFLFGATGYLAFSLFEAAER